MKQRESDTDKAVLIFVHIPKTAGKSLNPLLYQHYSKERCYHLTDPFDESVEQLRRMPSRDRDKFDCILGHAPFGLHECLNRPARYITFLRDPVLRTLSFYYYVRGRPQNPYYEWATSHSLQDLLNNGLIRQLDNGQTRYIAGVGDEPGYGQCDEVVLEMAKRNISDHFAMVGLTERFDETMLLLQKELSWSYPFYQRRNVNIDRPSIDAIPGRTIESILEHNRHDLELYRFAAELFETVVKRYKPLFQLELASYKIANWLVGKLYHPAIKSPG